MKDINDYLPRLPKHSLGLALDWVPRNNKELDMLTKPLPFDSKWHMVNKVPNNDGLLIDGKHVKIVDDSKLT